MKDDLAERLLGEVMHWTPQELASERPWLLNMATYKYNDYQQYSPGMRFIETLALWLDQFSMEEKQIAYQFVKDRLVFISHAEMNHVVSLAYQDSIRPWLLRRTASKLGIPEWKLSSISRSPDFKQLKRRCLFLGMSDGARTDLFRRVNKHELDHEQILQYYDISEEKARDLREKLQKDLSELSNGRSNSSDSYFQIVFLMDDFSGSGTSIIKRGANELSGKMAKIHKEIRNSEGAWADLISLEDLHICVVLYVATQKAINHINNLADELLGGQGAKWKLICVHPLDEKVPLQGGRNDDQDFLNLCDQDRYYDSSVEDEHMRKGGTNAKRGFAGCALPLVLNHNTPNNSVFLLWADPGRHEKGQPRGLFPRIPRHGGKP
ncbi:MAG: hypothetical protein HY913_07820 [Desulfomonile tiedjei]|nr:hypothetical protein [Desulfomonile tiedjei]